MSLFGGIDAGTSGVRCLLVDERGSRVGYGERSWSTASDATGMPLLDAAAVARAVAEAIGDAFGGVDPAAVARIGVTSQRTGVVFLDDGGEPLYVGPNSDGRAFAQGLEQERASGDDIYRIAGRLPAMLYAPARLAWARAERPDWAVTRMLSLGDWIVFALTGRACTEPMQAAELLVYDVAAGAWSDALLEALDVPRPLLPDLLRPGEAAGESTGALGLPASIPVVPAGGDTQCATLAMGARDAGDATVVAGSTMLAGVLLDEPAADAERRTWLSPTALEGRWVRECHCGEAGALVAWFAGILGTTSPALAGDAVLGDAGAGGVEMVDAYPSVVTDFPLVRRAALSFPAPVLALGRERRDIARAIFEGIAFGARAGLEWLDDPPGMIRAAGGVAASEVFLAALAGASGRSVLTATEPASSALGAAIVAASTHHGGVAAAAEAMADAGREVAPRETDGYPARYAGWKERASAMADAAMRMSMIR